MKRATDYGSNADLTEISCKILRDVPFEKAILVTDDDTNRIWLPRSQIEYEVDEKTGIATVTMGEWLAREKGLI